MYAQLPIDWDRTIGGVSWEELNGLAQSPDGILLGGASRSGDQFGRPGDQSWNLLFVKINLQGQTLWSRMYGGAQDERLWALIATSDGGYIAGGYSYSGASGDKTQANRGDMDIWIVKLNAAGQLMWERAYGGAGRDELFAIQEMPDGSGYLLGGHSTSDAGGEKSENSRGGQDFWILRIAPNGDLLWDATIGGDSYDQIYDLKWTPDGMILLSGGTLSTPGTGEVGPAEAQGSIDFWILKYDPYARQILWDKRYGSDGVDFAYALWPCSDGRILLGGTSGSATSTPTPYDNGKNTPFYGGMSDYWLLELNAEGDKIREWSFGGSEQDDLYYIHENELGQITLCGLSNSPPNGAKTSPLRGGYDFWIVQLGPDGIPRWQMTLGSAGNDALTRMNQLTDGSYLFIGNSDSPAGGEKSQASFGVNDFWVIKTRCDAKVRITPLPYPSRCSPHPGAEAIPLDALKPVRYRWQNGHEGPILQPIPAIGMLLAVRILDDNSCIARDTSPAWEPPPPPGILDAGARIMQQDNRLSLFPPRPDLDYLWSTGETAPEIVATLPGLYSLTLSDADGCSATLSAQIFFEKKYKIWAPNVFKPDRSGLNDHFSLFSNDSGTLIRSLRIYDRWGSIVFEKNNFAVNNEWEGWDGRIRNKDANPDVYVWLAQIQYPDGETVYFSGNVTLVR
ncbi:MAG: gliding motility-associated C-terminal domain-containing protein [Saprospiraceae bacterium]